MTKIYVAYQEGFMCDGWVVGAGLNKLELIKFDILKEHNQNSIIKVYDSETHEQLHECDLLAQRDNFKCNCPDCQEKDESYRWCSTNGVGNFLN